MENTLLVINIIVGIFGTLKGFIPDSDWVFPPFFTLQGEQAVTIFSQVVSPPWDLGIKWSNVKSLEELQYWHLNLSLKKTLKREKIGFLFGLM